MLKKGGKFEVGDKIIELKGRGKPGAISCAVSMMDIVWRD
jgi:hypothetical protein